MSRGVSVVALTLSLRGRFPAALALLASCFDSQGDAPGAPRTAAAATGASAARAAVAAVAPAASPAPARDGGAARAPLAFELCERAGAPPFQQLGVMLGIATSYDARRRADCRTAGLTPALSPTVEERWHAYLVNYGMALSGCPLTRGPAPGGISAFGPANTRAVGLERPPLGRDDAALLITMYLDPFAEALALSAPERAGVEAHLWEAAEQEIDADASGGLSRCLQDAGR